MLLIMLSELFGAFSISTGMDNYYIDVLGMASITLIVGIPGVYITPVSFSFVPWFRRHFSTKVNWMIGSYTGDFLMDLVWAIAVAKLIVSKKLKMKNFFMSEILWLMLLKNQQLN